MDKDEVYPVQELLQEIMAAKSLDSDLDFAFNLQMQEAITASLALHPSASRSPPQNNILVEYDDENDAAFDYTALLLEDVNRLEQERRDREQSEAEMRKMKEDLDRRIHDQKFANEIMSIPENEWQNYGDNYHKPYGEGCSSYSANLAMNESFRLYFKGLVSEERLRDVKVIAASVGVAICDDRDNLIWEVKKGLEDGLGMGGERAEMEALVQGLDAALSLDLKRVTFFCDDFMVYHYVTGRLEPRQSSIATLVNQVALLQRKFAYCQPSLVARNDIKFAFKFARDAIVSQITWPAEASEGKSLKETCAICFEDIDVEKMFSVDSCYHRYCFSCMKQHVEVKLLDGMMAKCPHEGCKSEVNVDSCGKFLDPKLVEILSQRNKEASIAVTEKVYCPYPKCSALMSKSEVLAHTKLVYVGVEQSGARKCMKCHHFFCINCKIPWHYDMTCYDYSRSNPHTNVGDAKLKSLAKMKRWRECIKCNNMIELAEGCYHITCRCGYEFCYICGAVWENKNPTCSCQIWDERNIIRR